VRRAAAVLALGRRGHAATPRAAHAGGCDEASRDADNTFINNTASSIDLYNSATDNQVTSNGEQPCCGFGDGGCGAGADALLASVCSLGSSVADYRISVGYHASDNVISGNGERAPHARRRDGGAAACMPPGPAQHLSARCCARPRYCAHGG
jgi:hypothetical protein